ncbi:marC integral membrane family protein [Bordetella holmesii 70147]|nr:marC integral membrane family protein [Bordetella holmesii 70147]
MVVSLTLYVCLRFAAQILHRLGENGTAVFMRMSAFIMLCLGVQIFWDGARELLLAMLAQSALAIPAPKL